MPTDKIATVKSTQPHKWQTRVCLRSNEGFPYEIDRQILIDSSGSFEDLFELSWPTVKAVNSPRNASNAARHDNPGSNVTTGSPAATAPLTLDQDIELDLSTNDLQLFFGFMQVTARFQFLIRDHGLDFDFEQARILCPLIDQYECESMRASLKAELTSLALFNPWELLHFACDIDDVNLGRTAIRNIVPRRLSEFIGSDRSTNGWTSLSKLSDAWQSEFLRLLLPGRQGNEPILLMELDIDVDGWSKKFDPKNYQEGIDGHGKRKRI